MSTRALRPLLPSMESPTVVMMMMKGTKPAPSCISLCASAMSERVIKGVICGVTSVRKGLGLRPVLSAFQFIYTLGVVYVKVTLSPGSFFANCSQSTEFTGKLFP